MRGILRIRLFRLFAHQNYPAVSQNLCLQSNIEDLIAGASSSCDASPPDDSDYIVAPKKWILARNSAVLIFLYGCGLRVSEVLSLDCTIQPLDADTPLRLKEKGEKTDWCQFYLLFVKRFKHMLIYVHMI